MNRYHVGDVLDAEVADFGMGGEGIVKLDGYPVFVPCALKGEKVKIKLNFVKRDYAFADLIAVTEPSAERIKPKCPYYARCGGCDMQHMSKRLQLETKRLNVERTLRKNAGLSVEVQNVVSLNEWEYRNKLALPFGDKGGHVVLGFYEKKSHWVVPMKFCPLHGDWAAKLISGCIEWASEQRIKAYDEKTHNGFLRHLVARKLDRIDVVIVGNGDEIPALKQLVAKLEKSLGDVKFCVWFSPNKDATNVIMGESVRLVHGHDTVQNVGGINAKISPLTFLQVNDKVRDAIYEKVADSLKDFQGDVVELYSGIGILTASLAKRLESGKFTSVEIVPEAVEDAKGLMKNAGVADRVECVLADAAEYMKSLPVDKKARALVLDPPRKGVEQSVIDAALTAGFDKIIYISCNPATLSRDIKPLIDAYDVETVQPYDMFPQTDDVETVLVLNKRMA